MPQQLIPFFVVERRARKSINEKSKEWHKTMPGTRRQIYLNKSKERQKSMIFLLSFMPCFLPVAGTRYQVWKQFPFYLFFVPCFLQVNLYLYITVRTLYSRTYVVHIQQCGTRWSESVIPVASGGIAGHIATKLHELKTVLDAGGGWWSAWIGAFTDVTMGDIDHALVVWEGQTSTHSQKHQYTNTHNTWVRKNN